MYLIKLFILSLRYFFSVLSDDTPETCIYSNWSPWSACSSSTCEKGKRMRQRMLKAQLDLSVPCPHTQDFEPCMGPGCSDEGQNQTHTKSGFHSPDGNVHGKYCHSYSKFCLKPHWGTSLSTVYIGSCLLRGHPYRTCSHFKNSRAGCNTMNAGVSRSLFFFKIQRGRLRNTIFNQKLNFCFGRSFTQLEHHSFGGLKQ